MVVGWHGQWYRIELSVLVTVAEEEVPRKTGVCNPECKPSDDILKPS